MMAPEQQDKKRKRHSDKAENPRKKLAVNGDFPHAENVTRPEKSIRLMHTKAGEDDTPVIATAPGMTIPKDISLEAYRRRKPTNELLLHSSKHPRIDYTARESQDGGLAGNMKHYIGIYDSEKQEMQLVEAKKMSVHSTLRSEEAELRKEQEAKQETTLNKRQQLGLEFGTKKAQKAIRSLTDNAISSSQLPSSASQQEIQESIKANPQATAVLESMAAKAEDAPTKEAMQAVVDEARPRPKHNPGAKKVKDVYPVNEPTVMGEELLQMVKVKPWFEAIENGEGVSTTSRFISNRLQDVILGRNEDSDAVRKVKVCRYLLMLVQFYRALRPAKKGGARGLPKPEVLREKLGTEEGILSKVKRKFAGGSELSKWHVDNLLTHIAVLSLYIDDFETDTYDLREDLGLPQKQIDTYFKEIGAKMSAMSEKQRTRMDITKETANLHKIAKLKLPLEFPKQRVVPLKRR